MQGKVFKTVYSVKIWVYREILNFFYPTPFQKKSPELSSNNY